MLAATGEWKNLRLTGRIVELDGIRGLAILLVLVWHYFVLTIGNSPNVLLNNILKALSLTWSGVDLFFVLSGFLIGGILYDAKGSDTYYKTFYLRRVTRIMPPYFGWFAIFAGGLLMTWNISSGPLHGVFNYDLPVWSYPLFVQNFFMSARQNFGAVAMGVTWSLAVEEQFYLLLPYVIKHLSGKQLVWSSGIAILAAPVIRSLLFFSGNQVVGPYTLLPCRADALGMGVLVAIVCRRRQSWLWLVSHQRLLWIAFGFLACVMAVLSVRRRYIYTIGLTWIDAFYALALLLAIVAPGSPLGVLLRKRVLTGLGMVAYTCYLLHQGINGLFHAAFLGQSPTVVDLRSAVVTIASLITVVLLANLSWRFAEKPLVRYAHQAFQYKSTERVLVSR